jgi:hypothetical protein
MRVPGQIPAAPPTHAQAAPPACRFRILRGRARLRLGPLGAAACFRAQPACGGERRMAAGAHLYEGGMPQP